MTYDAVLFDLDGTLVASAPGIINAACYALEQMGVGEADEAVIRQFIGPPLFASFQKHFGFSPEQAQTAIDHYRVYYTEKGLYECSVYQGLPNLLRALRGQGVKLCVATAKPQVFAEKVLAHLGLARFFDKIVGVGLNHRAEEKHAILQAALPQGAARVAMVGDRRYDMEAARALGVDGIGVAFGYGTHAELMESGAVHVVDDVAALHALLVGSQPQRGFFISAEGLDGSGKTTKVQAICRYIAKRGYDVLHTFEPGGTPITDQIRNLVLSPTTKGMHDVTEALLYAAARAQHVRETLRPALEAGRVVVCDRYVDSSIAYQGVGRGLGREHIRAINAPAVDGTMPDMTLLFRVSAETAMCRKTNLGELDRIEGEKLAFHAQVARAYDELAAAESGRFRVIDAEQSMAHSEQEAFTAIDELLASR